MHGISILNLTILCTYKTIMCTSYTPDVVWKVSDTGILWPTTSMIPRISILYSATTL